jgi:hypothetical protein
MLMHWSEAVCLMMVYFLEHLIHFVLDAKPVDTCFHARTTSGIFNLGKLAFYILRKII